MMKINARNALPAMSAHAGPNMTPMVDVVMCLIIFFMLCGTLSAGCRFDFITLPKAVNTPHELPRFPGDRLVINVAPADPHAAAAEPQVVIRGTRLTTLNDLTAFLRAEKSENPSVRVILRADENLAYSWIAPVLVSCAQADIHSVHFSTRQD